MTTAQLQSALSDLTRTSYSSPTEQSAVYNKYVDDLISANLGVIVTRPLLSTLISSLASSPSEVKVTVGSHIADALASQAASYEEQNSTVREILASGYEEEEEWTKAAQALQGIQLDSTQRQISDLIKTQTWIRIVRCYLEDDDTVSAETALNKIKNSTSALQVLQDSPELQLHYQLSQARILDSRRDFLNAAAEYLQVSFSRAVAEDDRLQALSAAIKTAILAGAGAQRSRMLGRLYKDERSLEVPEYAILEKMYLDRLLAPAEVKAFAESLAPHQLASTADGSTVLSKAVTEHNLLATSRLYESISTRSLAALLDLQDSKDSAAAAEKAEDVAARMIEQGRLKAEIDQIDGVIRFQTIEDVAIGGQKQILRQWDLGVLGLVEDVERVATGIAERYPALADETMVS